MALRLGWIRAERLIVEEVAGRCIGKKCASQAGELRIERSIVHSTSREVGSPIGFTLNEDLELDFAHISVEPAGRWGQAFRRADKRPVPPSAPSSAEHTGSRGAGRASTLGRTVT
jgi:hypothetical protein